MLDPRQKAIFDHYGFPHQLDKLREECLELVEAIDDFKAQPVLNWTHVEEEMADVLNVIGQFCGGGLARMRVDDIRDQKLDRQIKRIREEEACAKKDGAR